MLTIRSSDGNVVSQTRNLRGILDHARRFSRVTTLRNDGRTLEVYFANGDTCTVVFVDARALEQWCDRRERLSRGGLFVWINRHANFRANGSIDA